MRFIIALAALVAGTFAQSHQHVHLRHRQDETSDDSQVDYVDMVVMHHNLHRSNHSASNISYHYGLADTAQKIANSCNFSHNMNTDGGGYGQNIAAGIPWYNISAVITDLWYNSEASNYDPNYNEQNPDMSNFEGWGHFSQIVWKNTTWVGCYTQHCPEGVINAEATYDYTVCNYGAPGNMAGTYADNVGDPQGQQEATWAYGYPGH